MTCKLSNQCYPAAHLAHLLQVTCPRYRCSIDSLPSLFARPAHRHPRAARSPTTMHQFGCALAKVQLHQAKLYPAVASKLVPLTTHLATPRLGSDHDSAQTSHTAPRATVRQPRGEASSRQAAQHAARQAALPGGASTYSWSWGLRNYSSSCRSSMPSLLAGTVCTARRPDEHSLRCCALLGKCTQLPSWRHVLRAAAPLRESADRPVCHHTLPAATRYHSYPPQCPPALPNIRPVARPSCKKR